MLLQGVADQDFAVMTYTDAVKELKGVKKKFEFPVEWGIDLQTEHERFLAEQVFQGRPLILTNYPADIKVNIWHFHTMHVWSFMLAGIG